jgi:hypothetical protein
MDSENTSLNTDTQSDNSSEVTISQEEIGKLLKEPTQASENDEGDKPTVEEAKKEPKDNTIECPDKFKNQDGTPNWANVLKSYKELEPLIQEKATWTKERAELLKAKDKLDEINRLNEQNAKNAGYDSVEDMQQKLEVANVEVNEYAKYLQYTDDPEATRKLLIQYANNPSEELMEQIEVEFAPDVNKRVAIVSEKKKQEYEALNQQNAETRKYTNIENVVSQTVEKHTEMFKYEPFKNLFTNILHRFGDNFTYDDAQVLVGAVNDLKKAFQEEFEKQSGQKIQNDKAIDSIASLNTNNSAPVARQYSNEDLSKMSSAELAQVIKKYI